MITYLTFFPKDVPSGKLWNAWKTTIFQCGKSSLKSSTDSDWALASTANCNKYLEGNWPNLEKWPTSIERNHFFQSPPKPKIGIQQPFLCQELNETRNWSHKPIELWVVLLGQSPAVWKKHWVDIIYYLQDYHYSLVHCHEHVH